MTKPFLHDPNAFIIIHLISEFMIIGTYHFATISYEDISLRANRARYKGKMKKIFLEGSVEARKGFVASQGGNASTSLSNHGMVLKAKKAVINLETETIEAVGGVNAILGRTLP